MEITPFTQALQKKIDELIIRRKGVNLNSLFFDSPLLLAPMSSICEPPFRLLMEQLGAGGTVSELISCHGINHGNERTRKMLTIHPGEKNIGLQLFGEDAESMAKAAKVAQESNPKFIDINMGCPVKKVVTKGGGSALLKDPVKLGEFFGLIKKGLEIPLTIKIRTGWDESSINAREVIHIAKSEGVEFVAIHGRTRAQQYRGEADWKYLESLNEFSPLPLIGNGDLHTPETTRKRMKETNCQALMLGRGPLRNPFLFLEAYDDENEFSFTPRDYYEVIEKLFEYTQSYAEMERTLVIQMRKFIVWMMSGFDGVAKFRGEVFKTPSVQATLKLTRQYLYSLEDSGKINKSIDYSKPFMTSGHG